MVATFYPFKNKIKMRGGNHYHNRDGNALNAPLELLKEREQEIYNSKLFKF